MIKLNNQYYLYYSASVWGTKLSGIGFATSPTLDPSAPNYGWTDQGQSHRFEPIRPRTTRSIRR